MWQPKLLPEGGPLYERIALALERDIRAGLLKHGDRLPTLRDLASKLEVTPGTVSRAYEVAHRGGWIEGEVGRGTFVSSLSVQPEGAPKRKIAGESRLPDRTAPSLRSGMPVTANDEVSGPDWLDLSIVKPNLHIQEPYIRSSLMELAYAANLPEMLDYTPDGGLPLHRQAGAAWMQRGGLAARAEQVLLTAGAQHGLWVAINAITRPGDLVFCESLCYPGVASVVHSLGRRLQGIPIDADGMRVDALREACFKERPAMVVCIANFQNPTCSVMPVTRRSQIAETIREFNTVLVDDDLYGFLSSTEMPPLASFAPERSLYLTSLSKSVLSTVRLGYIHAPAEWLGKLAASVRSSIWMVSPLAAQIATNLINNGKADELAQAQKDEARARQLMARELLGASDFDSQPTAFHLWLRLPSRWASGDQFAGVARGHGLIVAPGDSFSMNQDGEGRRHIRVSIMAGTQDRMRFAMSKLAGLLSTADVIWL